MTTANSIVAHIAICVSDLDRSADFYINALGFSLLREIGELGAPFDTLVELPGNTLQVKQLMCGEVRIELVTYSGGVTGNGLPRPMNQVGFTHMTLVVQDMAATLEAIVKYGGQIMEQTRVDSAYGPIVFCTDPDGTRIEIMQPPA